MKFQYKNFNINKEDYYKNPISQSYLFTIWPKKFFFFVHFFFLFPLMLVFFILCNVPIAYLLVTAWHLDSIHVFTFLFFVHVIIIMSLDIFPRLIEERFLPSLSILAIVFQGNHVKHRITPRVIWSIRNNDKYWWILFQMIK